jgi:hypothetical protein
MTKLAMRLKTDLRWAMSMRKAKQCEGERCWALFLSMTQLATQLKADLRWARSMRKAKQCL